MSGTARRDGGKNELGETARVVDEYGSGGQDGRMRKTAPPLVSFDGMGIR